MHLHNKRFILPRSVNDASQYHSVDPAPAPVSWKARPTSDLRATLLDASLPLFDRYKAMFALRNRCDEASVLVSYLIMAILYGIRIQYCISGFG